MSKKVTQEEFLRRFHRSYPDSTIELLDYTAISNPLTIECGKCGKIYHRERAREFLSHFSCCGAHAESKIEKLKKIYARSDEFHFIKQLDRNYFIVHHNKCGNDLRRTMSSALDNPFACSYCQTIKTNNMLSIKEVQSIIDDKFFGNIQILDYDGQLKSNHYKCLKCGLIFKQKQICLMQSRGCPKCNRYKSHGEVFIAQYLSDHAVIFKEQVSVDDLPLQHFDFAVYDQNGSLLYFIEVQGEQHREEREIFRDGLQKIQERDQRKRDYCSRNNIPLYELIYSKGIIQNLGILPI